MSKKWKVLSDKYIYKPKKKLGSGGNANVYLAIDISSGEELAVKILNTTTANFEVKIKRFIIETELVVKIQNNFDGVIPIYYYNLNNENDKLLWYIMPKATPLEKVFRDKNELNEKIECVIQIAKVLCDLHKVGVIHRDIKPSNLYKYKEKYSLGDFGLVDYPEKLDLTRTQESIGAKATIAPEMKIDPKNSDGKKADVYSLAKTLWMILTNNFINSFEGIYNPASEIMGLRKYFSDLHLVELEELLIDSTQDNPELRPTMKIFYKRLIEWNEIRKDFKKSNLSEWKYVQSKLFSKTIPKNVFGKKLMILYMY